MKTSKLAMVIVAGLSSNAWADSFTLDPTHTYPNFTVSHLGFSTMHGRFNKSSGKMTLDMKKGSGSVEVTIEAGSIDTGFAKRDKHLRGQDFLNAAEFPNIIYKSTNVKIENKKTAIIDGQLTITGISKPVQLKVDQISCGMHPFNKKQYVCGFNATAVIRRSDFGIKYGLPAIGDEMQLSIEIEAVKDK